MGLIFNEKVVEKCNSVDKSTIAGWKKKKKKKKKEKRRLQNANAIVGSRFEVQAQVIWCIGPMSPIQ